MDIKDESPSEEMKEIMKSAHYGRDIKRKLSIHRVIESRCTGADSNTITSSATRQGGSSVCCQPKPPSKNGGLGAGGSSYSMTHKFDGSTCCCNHSSQHQHSHMNQ